MKKYALISGAAGGLAQEAIIALRHQDYHVFALDINPDIKKLFSDSEIQTFACDITNQTEVESVFAQIKTRTNRLDLVANMAGLVTMGSLIEMDYQTFTMVQNVNLHGMFLINKLAFPFLKEAQGKIINMSSEYGFFQAVPFNAAYSISKHAVENYNDALRREIQKFGVQVIKIRLGAFKTGLVDGLETKFNRLLANTTYYEKTYKKMKYMMVRELERAKDPKIFGQKFGKIMRKKRNRFAYNYHISKKMHLLSLLPARLQDFIYSKYFK